MDTRGFCIFSTKQTWWWRPNCRTVPLGGLVLGWEAHQGFNPALGMSEEVAATVLIFLPSPILLLKLLLTTAVMCMWDVSWKLTSCWIKGSSLSAALSDLRCWQSSYELWCYSVIDYICSRGTLRFKSVSVDKHGSSICFCQSLLTLYKWTLLNSSNFAKSFCLQLISPISSFLN